MSSYDNAIKLVEEACGNGKEVVIALATISDSAGASGNPRPAVRMVCAYYEDGDFYVSTDARSTKMLEIEKNSEVAGCVMDWFSFKGTAENLGWVMDDDNSQIRATFKEVFDWFEEEGEMDSPDSIVLRITATEGTLIDHKMKFGQKVYEIDFMGEVLN